MNFINQENIFTTKQLWKYIKLLGNDYRPKEIVVIETRFDIIKYIFKSLLFSRIILEILLGKIEGLYLPILDRVYIFVFSQNDDGEDKQSKQLYSLHALTHELRHRWQKHNKLPPNEEDADEFATNFINKNSPQISRIMKWKDEWEVEEE